MSEAFPSPGLLPDYRVGMGQPPNEGQGHGTQQGRGLETGKGWDVPCGGGRESRAGKLQMTTLQFAKSWRSARRCEAPGNRRQHSRAPGLDRRPSTVVLARSLMLESHQALCPHFTDAKKAPG